MAEITLIAEGMPDLEKRFWAFVHHEPTTGCFLWAGGVAGGGYGAFAIGRRMYPAHRVAWLLSGKQLPPKGKVLRHSCDQRACVNVDHLTIGSQVENMDDMAKRNRGRIGRDLPFGVCRGHRSDRFVAGIRFAGKRLYIGTFDTVDEAHQAAIRAKTELRECT